MGFSCNKPFFCPVIGFNRRKQEQWKAMKKTQLKNKLQIVFNILLSNVETKTKVNNWLFGNKKQWLLQRPILFEFEYKKLSFSEHEKIWLSEHKKHREL